MKDVEKTGTYVENPLQSLFFWFLYKDKKLDARKKFA